MKKSQQSGVGEASAASQDDATPTPSSQASTPPSSPESHKGAAREAMDYETFRREKNKQAARDFRDRQKKTLLDLNNRVRALETERNALTARLLHRESEAQLYEQQIADYRDLLLLYSVRYGTDGVLVSPPALQRPQPADVSDPFAAYTLPVQQPQQQQEAKPPHDMA